MILLLALVILMLLALQLAIPHIAARRIARQLVEGGGEAEVVVKAFPALRLLWRGGDRLRVDGSQLEIGMSKEGGGLSSLDGFYEVSIHLAEFRTGPFEIRYFQLSRRGPGPYVMRSVATTSGAGLIDYGAATGIVGAPLLASLARQAPLGDRRFPIEVEVELASAEGLLTVVSGTGTIAGYPAGPIASAIAAAVARRLELDY
jgi:hypothetical protein